MPIEAADSTRDGGSSSGEETRQAFAPAASRDLPEPFRVGAFRRADHNYRVADFRQRLAGGLPVACRIADALRLGGRGLSASTPLDSATSSPLRVV
jgi:hypothetical protein